MFRMTHRPHLFVIVLLIVLVTACNPTVSQPESQPMPTQPSVPSAMPSFTVTGEIQEIAVSAGVIKLKQTLEGFNSIMMTDETSVVGIDNAPLPFKELVSGMTVEATGTANGTSAINAARIRVTQMPRRSAKAAPMDVSYEQVKIAEGGLTLDVPKGWAQRGIEWAWGNQAAANQVVGVNWNERKPGWVPTALLPNHSVNKGTSELPEIQWGKATAYMVEVYDSAAGGGKLVSAEMHVIVLTDARAYDIYASTKTTPELESLKPIVLHMADSVVLIPTAVDAAGQVVNGFINSVQSRELDKGMALWTLSQPDAPKDYERTIRALVSTWIKEQPHWAIAGPTVYSGPVAPKNYQPMAESDPRVERALVNVRLGNLDGAFSLVKVEGEWRIAGWMQP